MPIRGLGIPFRGYLRLARLWRILGRICYRTTIFRSFRRIPKRLRVQFSPALHIRVAVKKENTTILTLERRVLVQDNPSRNDLSFHS